LILRKIIKIVATRCHILKLKCTKFDFNWGSAPDPAGGAYRAPQTLYLDLRGLLLRQERGGKTRGRAREGRGEGRVGNRGERREEDRKEGEVKGEGDENFRAFPQLQIYHYSTGCSMLCCGCCAVQYVRLPSWTASPSLRRCEVAPSSKELWRYRFVVEVSQVFY